MKITEASIRSLVADPRNVNKGTVRGREALRQSLERFGAGRSILVAKDGTILAGNKTWESALAAGIEEIIEVETDGKQLVAVRRIDLDPDSDEAREYALADNRVGELDLEYDPVAIQAMLNDGLELDWLFERVELDDLLSRVPEFVPVGLEEQGRLDEKAQVCCPNCGHSFVPTA